MDAPRNLSAELARLEAAAQGAGCAMVCAHQSADEFHRGLVRAYLDMRNRIRARRNLCFGVAAALAVAGALALA